MEVGATSFLFFRLSPSLVVSPFGLHLCIYLCTTDRNLSHDKHGQDDMLDELTCYVDDKRTYKMVRTKNTAKTRKDKPNTAKFEKKGWKGLFSNLLKNIF